MAALVGFSSSFGGLRLTFGKRHQPVNEWATWPRDWARPSSHPIVVIEPELGIVRTLLYDKKAGPTAPERPPMALPVSIGTLEQRPAHGPCGLVECGAIQSIKLGPLLLVGALRPALGCERRLPPAYGEHRTLYPHRTIGRPAGWF